MIKRLLKELKEFKGVAILTPFLMIGEAACELIIPVFMGRIVDYGIYGGNMGYILKMGFFMIMVAVCGFGFGISASFTGSKAGAGFGRNLRKAMHDHIQTFSFQNIDSFSTSSLVTRLTTDVANIQNTFMMLIRGVTRAPMMMLIAMALTAMISPKIASVYLVALAFLSVIMVFLMGRTTRYFKQVFQKYDKLNESVQENVSAIRVVKAYVREDQEISKFDKAVMNIYTMFVQAEMNVTVAGPIMSGSIYGCILFISWLGAHLIVQNELTTGELMSVLTYCMSILSGMMFFAMIFIMLSMSEASLRRIYEVITAESTIHNPENPVMEVPDGSIVFEDVDFSYNSDAHEAVLKDIALSIHSGETIGIIGATGSAKSSLVNLISRLYDTTAGSVKVGGHDVREYDLTVLRDAVSVVLQKNVLFSGTILDNLRWGDKNATEEECRRACELACASEFIEKMPDGYNTFIEQGGSNVSGGQKQRLCIARALMKKPKILILDDSTSAVDTATDAKIRKAFREELPNMTKLIIAQRISSVKDADRIIVMEDGRVNGFGTHDELLENNAIYRDVYESQTGAGNDDADFDEKK